MDCPKCGALNPDSATFCGLCFVSLVEPEPSVAVVVPDPPQQAETTATREAAEEEPVGSREPDVIFIGGPEPVPVADYGGNLRLENDIDQVWFLQKGDVELVEAMGLVGSTTVRRLREFYLNIIRQAERGQYKHGGNTPAFARALMPKLAPLNLGERIDQRRQDERSRKVDFIRRATGEVLMELAPTEIPYSPAAYMRVYGSVVRAAREGQRSHDPRVVEFVEDVLPKFYNLGPAELVDDVREPDGRLALKVRSTGEVLGYIPRVN